MRDKVKITNVRFYKPWSLFASLLLALFYWYGYSTEIWRTYWLILSPIFVCLLFFWIRAAFRVKEVYYTPGFGLHIDYKGDSIDVPFTNIQSVSPCKFPKGMPARVDLIEPAAFGNSFYFHPRFFISEGEIEGFPEGGLASDLIERIRQEASVHA